MKHNYFLSAILFLTFINLNAQNVTISGTNCQPMHDGAATTDLDQNYTYQGNLSGDPSNAGFAGLSAIWKYWFTDDALNIIASDDQGNFVLAHTNNKTIYYTAIGTPLGNVPCNGWVEASGNYCNQANIVISGDCENNEVLSTESNNDFLSTITIYPNPVSDKLSITNSELSIQEINIFDFFGRKVIIYTQNLNEIDLTNLPSGNYLIKIITEKGVVFKKIIKQ